MTGKGRRSRGPALTPLPLFLVALVGLVVLALFSSAPASAQDDGDGEEEPVLVQEGDEAEAEDPERAALLREGSVAYGQICSSCHQAGGIGIEGRYPPLVGNPRVDDTEYVLSVITNGLSGELEVAGVTYDSVMPSFSTLPDADTEAVIAFIQNDFVAPAPLGAEPAGPTVGTDLPILTDLGAWLAYLLAAAVGGLVLLPRVAGANDRLNVPWLDAWLKTIVIVVVVILLTVILPDWILKRQSVAELGDNAQDFVGVAFWVAGMAIVLGGLWYAHRESRV